MTFKIMAIIFTLLVAFSFITLVFWRKIKNYCFIRYTNNEEDMEQRYYRLPSVGLIMGGIAAITSLIIIFNAFYMIKPGEVGIVVDLFGSKKGIEEQELNVGLYFVPPWKKVYTFPIYEQNHQWVEEEGFSFQTYEGLPVKADIGITFNLEPTRVHELFYKYRRGMQEITHLFIKNTIRDAINRAASKMKIEDLYGSKKEEFFETVHKEVREELKPIGFNISHIFIIGKFGVPDIVMTALNKKIEATQRAQQRENELREAEAQAKKEIAQAEGIGKSKVVTAGAEAQSLLIKAEAEAKANDMISRSLTPDLLKWQAINKWDGELPNALSGEGSSFLIDLKK